MKISRRSAAFAVAGLAITTLLLSAVREHLDKVHIALALLLVVLGSSAVGGWMIGLLTAVAGFLIFNFFFLQPLYTFVIADPLDWLVLVAFLVTGIIAARLLARAQREAESARRHAAEVELLSAEAAKSKGLVEADRLKDALLATVSHDLRTPLTTIRAHAQDIGVDGDERGFVIAEEADHLNRLVADLLDLSQVRAGSVPVSIAMNAAEDLMGAVLQRVSGLSRGRDLRASLDPADPVLVGRFDFALSLRILANLLENALKYAPTDSTIEFSVHRDGTRLHFDVADRGPGIPSDAIARLFEPFVRGSDAPSGPGGAGLGLAIAQGLANAQGGSLTYRPRDGGGSVFTLRLPAADLSGAQHSATLG